MIMRRKVGVSPGTTMIKLGAPPSWRESCIPALRPIQSAPFLTQDQLVAATSAANAPTAASPATIMNPYASEVELKGRMMAGLGMIPIPYGYIPGQPAGEIVGAYTDAFGRRGCDPQHYTRGEQGYYYDTQLGDNDNDGQRGGGGQFTRAGSFFGRAIPTDAELAYDRNYTPVVSQWVTDTGGRMWPLPWMPPNGWDVNAGNTGAQPTPPVPLPPPLGDAASDMAVATANAHEERMFWIGAISAGAAVLVAGASIWSCFLRGPR